MVAIVVVVMVIAVVVLVIKGAAILAAIGAVLAFAGKVLLVIGVVAGLLAVGWALYRMITTPGLSWRERGRLFGEALLEVALAFAGTGILKRLGVFAQVGRLQAFIARVGGLGIALRLINRIPIWRSSRSCSTRWATRPPCYACWIRSPTSRSWCCCSTRWATRGHCCGCWIRSRTSRS